MMIAGDAGFGSGQAVLAFDQFGAEEAGTIKGDQITPKIWKCWSHLKRCMRAIQSAKVGMAADSARDAGYGHGPAAHEGADAVCPERCAGIVTAAPYLAEQRAGEVRWPGCFEVAADRGQRGRPDVAGGPLPSWSDFEARTSTVAPPVASASTSAHCNAAISLTRHNVSLMVRMIAPSRMPWRLPPPFEASDAGRFGVRPADAGDVAVPPVAPVAPDAPRTGANHREDAPGLHTRSHPEGRRGPFSAIRVSAASAGRRVQGNNLHFRSRAGGPW